MQANIEERNNWRTITEKNGGLWGQIYFYMSSQRKPRQGRCSLVGIVIPGKANKALEAGNASNRPQVTSDCEGISLPS